MGYDSVSREQFQELADRVKILETILNEILPLTGKVKTFAPAVEERKEEGI